jgi:hypothetical protein
VHVAALEKCRAEAPAQRLALLETSERLRDALGAAGIPCLFFKGLTLGERFYGDAARRHQWDVDVLVHAEDFVEALHAVQPIGFDLSTGTNGKPVERRLEKMRTRDPRRAPQTVTLRLGPGLSLDLHCRLKSRLFHGFDEAAVWRDRRSVRVLGSHFETFSDDHTLAFLLLSICGDLRRSALRGKLLLDLYLGLRSLGDDLDWEAFFARRADERVERAAANACAIFLALLDAAPEFPALGAALERRLELVELRDAEEAHAIVTRPRGSRWNRLWFLRLRAGSSPWPYWALRASLDLPRALRRRRGPPWSRAAARS